MTMTTAEAYRICKQLEEYFLETKEYDHVEVALKINWLASSPHAVSLDYSSTQYGTGSSETFKGETAEIAFEKCKDAMEKLPSITEARRADFQRSLGELIDTAKEIGLEVSLINPLKDAMEKLSENVITHQPEDDGVPF